MIVLALDTTGRAGSAAIVQGGVVLAELSGDPAVTHGQRLPGELMRLVDDAGIALEAVDLLAVAAGPGSFTGLRVGIATMQGLAVATGKPIVPVSTLEALARAGFKEGDALVAPWIDAQRGEVFGALYDTGRTPIGEPTALPPAATLTSLATIAGGRRIRLVGDGAVRYRTPLRARSTYALMSIPSSRRWPPGSPESRRRRPGARLRRTPLRQFMSGVLTPSSPETGGRVKPEPTGGGTMRPRTPPHTRRR